mmetsp:Transcript_10720/g.23264  ORF Transcript_10720/g.23264 Transcript_10720/m.23264 type:complete len:209 (-) Transcript_10720:189-815(-)
MHPRRVGLPPRSHTGYDSNVAFRAVCYQVRLRRDVVYGVYYHVPFSSLRRVQHHPVLLLVSGVHLYHRIQHQALPVGTYPPQVAAQHRRLGQPHVVERRHRVSVQAAQRDLIEVHETEVLDSRAGEHVGGVGPHASEAHDEDTRVRDAFHSPVGVRGRRGGEVEGIAGEHFGAYLGREADRRRGRISSERIVIIMSCRRRLRLRLQRG